MYTQHKHYIASNMRRRRKKEEEEAKREFRQHKKFILLCGAYWGMKMKHKHRHRHMLTFTDTHAIYKYSRKRVRGWFGMRGMKTRPISSARVCLWEGNFTVFVDVCVFFLKKWNFYAIFECFLTLFARNFKILTIFTWNLTNLQENPSKTSL